MFARRPVFSMFAALVIGVIGVIGVAACGESPAQTETLHSPVASACAHAQGNTLKVMVEFEKHCLSSSCDTVKSAACSLSRDGIEITVTGEAVVETMTDQACTSDCRALTASCEVELEPGRYRVQAGKQLLEVLHPPSAPVGSCERLG